MILTFFALLYGSGTRITDFIVREFSLSNVSARVTFYCKRMVTCTMKSQVKLLISRGHTVLCFESGEAIFVAWALLEGTLVENKNLIAWKKVNTLRSQIGRNVHVANEVNFYVNVILDVLYQRTSTCLHFLLG